MNSDQVGLFSALLSERKKTYTDHGSCEAKGGECRFLHPFNSQFSGDFWTPPIPTKECSGFGCPFWEK